MSEAEARPARLSRTAKAAAGRLSWGLADQAASSLTNLLVGLVVARSLSVAEFGMFSLAWVTYSVVINVSRGLATDALAVRFAGVPVDRWRDAVARASGTALLLGVLLGTLSGLIGFLMGPTGSAFLGLGLVMPALLLQDAWRFGFFAAGQGHKAFVNDVVWGLTLIPAMMIASRHDSVFAFVLAWGIAAAVAALVGCFQARIVPRPTGVAGWLRRQRDLGLRYMAENLSISSATQLRMYGLGAIAGLADVGAVRGAQLLLGPFLALLMGTALVAVPEAARVLRREPAKLPRFCALLGGSQAVAGGLWGLGLLVLLPTATGAFLLGEVWGPAAALIVPTTLTIMAACLSDGALVGLRALGAAPRSLRTQLFASTVYVGFGLLGAAVDGASGSAWGVAAATSASACVGWWQLRLGLREHRAFDPITARDHEEMRSR
jgi:O-antigen/teichoic acid export membrane protein